MGWGSNLIGQKDAPTISYIQPEYNIGKLIPNYLDTFPKTTVQQGLYLSFGRSKTDTNSWARYYNYPSTGIVLHYANYGNNAVFGHSFGANPYISFKVFNKSKANYRLKMSLGIAYFTNHFDSTDNINNNMIGSPFTWDYKLFLYRTLVAKENYNINIGFGFSHESNGHTRMPNMGTNSALFSITGQFFKDRNNFFEIPSRLKGRNFAPKQFFVHFRQGYGYHEQNRTEGPKTGRSLPVYSTSVGMGYIFNNHIKFRTGFTYKFYEQFNTHLNEVYIPELADNQTWNSSALVWYVGNEFLMGHVGFDTEVGFNLHKPFYAYYHTSSKIAIRMMRLVATRLGLNLYLLNTNDNPGHNFFIGANINANLGKADFTEFSIGYTKVFRRKLTPYY